eukprot:CAMPEP_0202457124 /NCGR_PEP_ID=MMETSP1360-20130828/14209_1 /ASSEMBLY_ACC=CAM_ASM_000848 /TAXON_ID=515479 /ORGANISM="Licmophora paradoxa, Strain CCMP2313" /LENGTH=139 /DNA_ID=CAMNT_0049077115 /DNA_START=211 /DNA_END=627 /DNA_ORIENTATION=+
MTKNQKKPGTITFGLPLGSSRPDKVYFFEEEIKYAKDRYGTDRVVVVDFASISMSEQADIIVKTDVFLVNHGGGSAISLFLPRGTSVILFTHNNIRMDHIFYESVGHFRTIWISEEERPLLNRTVALLDQEIVKANLDW